MTYEGARSILGPLLQNLGASAAQVGFVAGAGEMVAASLRVFSGRAADRTRAYWPFVFLGYGVNVIIVPALAFVTTWPAAAALIIAERTGKSLRGPARDVLLSGATREIGHGKGFGIHAAMDQIGAVLGPLLVVAIIALTGSLRNALLALVIPAALTLVALAVARSMRPNPLPPPSPVSSPLPRVFWRYVAAAGVMALGFADFPLLAYHVEKVGLVRPAIIPLLYAAAMGVSGLSSLFVGRLFDRHGITVLAASLVLSALALPLGFLGGVTALVIGVICWAIGMGAADATLRAGIAQVVHMDKRGTAFGAFNAVYGVMWFAGSAAMGLLYDRSIPALVIFGVSAQLVAAASFVALRNKLEAGS